MSTKLGQNFLVDHEAIERIANAFGDLRGRTVVEIGPGQGAITTALVARAAHVVAVELDHDLIPWLRVKFPADKLTVVEQDVLRFDFAQQAAERAQEQGGKLPVAGNLPYYITSPILLRLAAQNRAISTAILMVQREVADRVTAQPGSRDYGLLSVTVQMYGPATTLFTLPPQAFDPPPKVHSAVFRWRFAPRFDELEVEEHSFLRVVRQCFALKRKTLSNNLKAASYPNDVIGDVLQTAGFKPTTRAEAMSIEELAALWHSLKAANALNTSAAPLDPADLG